MSETQYEKNRKVSGGKKFLAVLGIFLVAIGIFLAAFGISFKMLMLPEQSKGNEDKQSEADRLKIENTQLEEDVRRLEEENAILKGGKTDDGSDSKSSDKSSSSGSSSSSGRSSSNSSSSSSRNSSSDSDED